jgi:hypothetical protein
MATKMKIVSKGKMKMGGAKKPKMMSGGAKPKAMYGATMKPDMMQTGGAKKKSVTKKSNPKSYTESDFANGSQMITTVEGPNRYKKEIEWQASGGGNSVKKPYTMTVMKGGKTNTFKLSEEQARNQRKIAKKEAGYKMGGATGKVGGVSKASKTAASKMKMGGVMKRK